jgi:hypothetical protein
MKQRAQNLKGLSEIFSFKGPETKGDEIKDITCCRTALEHLQITRKAEKSGLGSLEKMLKEL